MESDKVQTKTMHMTATERSQKFRQKLKSDSNRMEKAKEKDRKRKQQAREQAKKQKLTKQQVEQKREKKRLEMQRYRAKVKAEKAENITNPTSRQKGRCRAKAVMKHRLADKKYRQAQKQEQTKRRNAVLGTQNWRLRVTMQKCEQDDKKKNAFSSYWIERRSFNKAKKALPKSPVKRAAILEKLSNDSPRTSKVLEKKGVITSPAIRRQLEMGRTLATSLKTMLVSSKPRGNANKFKLHAYKQAKSILTQAPMSARGRTWFHIKKYFKCNLRGMVEYKSGQDWWHMSSRKSRKDRLCDAVKSRVKAFLLSPDISREVPAKSEAVKIRSEDGTVTILPKHVMSMSIEEAYRLYKEAHPLDKIGLTSFWKLVPENLRKLTELNRRTCLCTKCCNFALKLDAVKKSLRSIKQDEASGTEDFLKMTKRSFADMVLCDYQDFPAKKCLERECDDCAPKFAEVFTPLEKIPALKEAITWYHWEYISITKEGKNKKVMSCVAKTTNLEVFKASLKEDVDSWPIHIFRASWQHKQLATSIESLCDGNIILLMDYSENYRCQFQDEVQSGYFDQRQITLHPAMAYYKEDNKLVKHAVIGVSPDTKHDAHLTKAFEDKTVELLRKQPGLNVVNRITEWTDGCAAQYKCRTSFADISLQEIEFSRNYFETSHGKSPCDGLGNVVKNTCLRAVTSGRTVISDVESLLDFCNEKLAHGAQVKANVEELSKWDFIFVSSVERNRDEVSRVQPVKGIRQMHSVRAIAPYQVETRILSCYCHPCRSASGHCENGSWVDPWSRHIISKVRSGDARRVKNPSTKASAHGDDLE